MCQMCEEFADERRYGPPNPQGPTCAEIVEAINARPLVLLDVQHLLRGAS